MFEGDYTINGKHATYIKYLVNDVKAFDRYIDVYMTGAALGALNDKRAKQDGSTDRARIYSDAFNTEHVKCNELFKVVILMILQSHGQKRTESISVLSIETRWMQMLFHQLRNVKLK